MFPARIPIISSPPSGLQNTYSLDFDGSNDYVECGTDSSLKITGDCTISCWVNFPDLTTANPIISLFGHGDGILLRKLPTSGYNNYIRVYRDGKHYDTTFGFNSADTWYHFVVVFDADGDDGYFYVNGSLETTADNVYSTDPGYATSNSSLTLGYGRDLGHYGNLLLDEVAIWNTALSAGSIAEIYNSGVPTDLLADSNSGSLQGWWRFEEGSGTSATDSSTHFLLS